jgi:CubicO group peptidase (beta-lactamase class C family)
MNQVEQLMRKAVAENIFPGAVLLISRNGNPVYHNAFGYRDLLSRSPVTIETIFDLASLTKPLATALALMVLVDDGKVGLDQHLGDVLPAFENDPKASIQMSHLLNHHAGLPDYRTYYREIEHIRPEKRRSALRQLLVKEPLVHQTGSRALYSDIGFMILEWVVEEISGKRLDRYMAEMVYAPLGLGNLFFVDLAGEPGAGEFAATEQCVWRRRLVCGQVHDENAHAAGGIGGHAGLFGTASDIHRLLVHLLLAYRGRPSTGRFQPETVRLFFQRWPGSDKTLGFDMPSESGSSSGRFFSPNSVGHLGFTGTSFWMDLERSIIVILLTNRVHPTRGNGAIKGFRPLLHDAVMRSLLKAEDG